MVAFGEPPGHSGKLDFAQRRPSVDSRRVHSSAPSDVGELQACPKLLELLRSFGSLSSEARVEISNGLELVAAGPSGTTRTCLWSRSRGLI